jgi:hypothetical protein
MWSSVEIKIVENFAVMFLVRNIERELNLASILMDRKQKSILKLSATFRLNAVMNM